MLSKYTISVISAAFVAISTQASADGHANADSVVATVNGTEITLGHMIVLKQRLPAQYQSLPGDVLFEGILDQLVQQTVLGQGSEELSSGSQKTLENEERALRAAEAIGRITESAMTDAALQAAYNASYGEATPETEYNASHILVETEEEALALVAELEEGKDFATLAQEKSTGPSGPNGGELGWFAAGVMVPEFETAVVGMETGSVSAPVQTQFGWHVIKLNDTRLTEAPSLDDVRGELADQVQREAIDARVSELSNNAEITRATSEDFDPALLDDLSMLED